MTVGEKIKYYRELRGLSQAQLSGFTGIPLGTIKKYEINNRNPKDAPLQKIADALQISINVFSEAKTDTIGDIAPFLFEIARKGNIQFHGKKDNDGKFDIDDLTFSFDTPVLKYFLKEWADRKEIIDNLRTQATCCSDETAKTLLLNRADEIEREVEMRMVDSQLLIERQKK